MPNSKPAGSLKNSPAVVNGRVYKINDESSSRPGPRSVDGLEELARALHPEVFNDQHNRFKRYSCKEWRRSRH